MDLEFCSLAVVGSAMVTVCVRVGGGRRKKGPHCSLVGGGALSPCRLDSCELMPVSCHILASALCGNRTLTHLCLSDNSLRTEEVRRLCRFMSNPECALQRLM